MVVQPYRKAVYNAIDVIFFLAIVQSFFSYAAATLSNFINRRFKTFTQVTLGIPLLFPLVYALLLAFKMLLPNKWIASVRNCFYRVFCKRNDALQVRVYEEAENDLLQYLATNEGQVLY